MSEERQHFQILMERLRAGSPEAASELLQTYGHHILRVVRRRLNRKLRSKFDSHDFVQSVWTSFFTNAVQNYSFERPEDLIAFLATVASNKVVDVIRQRMNYDKYNVNREHSLDGSAAAEAVDLIDHNPTPSQVAMANEQWDQLQKKATRPGRRILELLRQGVTYQEIAQTLGVTEKSIQRLVGRLASDPAAPGREQPPASVR